MATFPKSLSRTGVSQVNLVQYRAVKPNLHRIRFGERISTMRTAGRAVPIAPSADTLEYAYQYDDIGNRVASTDLGTNRTYTANFLNQYTLISNLCDSVTLCDDFVPQYDLDGNQTLVKTSTGVWQVSYNGENRQILWSCIQSNNPNNQPILSMSYDRMGRRVTKNDQRFFYDGQQ